MLRLQPIHHALRVFGHMGLANSAALRAAKVSRATRDIAGGVIVRDPRSGEPTGLLKDMAMGPMERAVPAPTDQQRDAALRRALAFAASKGVTAFAHLSSSEAPPDRLGVR
jgi:predicted amidohydrolase YtcJ